MKVFWNKYKKLLIGLAAALVLAGGWLLIWHRVGRQVEHAAYRSAFESLVYDGAYYKECTLETVQDYVPEAGNISDALCGTALGTLYACRALEDAGKEKAIVLLKKDAEYLAYELSGFQYLDGEPSVWAVCASYGIGKAADIESLTLADADGNVQERIMMRPPSSRLDAIALCPASRASPTPNSVRYANPRIFRIVDSNAADTP